MKKQSNEVKVALIGLIGVVAVALINVIPQIFKKEEPAKPVSVPPITIQNTNQVTVNPPKADSTKQKTKPKKGGISRKTEFNNHIHGDQKGKIIQADKIENLTISN